MDKMDEIILKKICKVNNALGNTIRNSLQIKCSVKENAPGAAQHCTTSFLKISQPVPQRSISDIFPWVQHINSNIRLQIMTDNTESEMLYVLKQYNRCLRDNLQNYLRLPNRCYLLSKNIIKTMLIFKLLSKRFTYAHNYLTEVCELLSIYTTLELRYSTKFEETKCCAANRIALNYEAHLRATDEKYILRVFMSIQNYYQQREIMRKLFRKYLTTNINGAVPKEISDETYVMYLISYKKWKSLEDNSDERSKIEDIANSRLRPSVTLRKNPTYAPFIPAYKTKYENATKFILSQNFCITSLIKKVREEESQNKVETENIIDLDFSAKKIGVSFNSGNDHALGNIKFPNIKLEKPEIIASIDLTSDFEIQRENELFWLDVLINKVRNVNHKKHQRKILETIILEDIESKINQAKSNEVVNDSNPNKIDRNQSNVDVSLELLQDIATMASTSRLDVNLENIHVCDEKVLDTTDKLGQSLSVLCTGDYIESPSHKFQLDLNPNDEITLLNYEKNLDSQITGKKNYVQEPKDSNLDLKGSTLKSHLSHQFPKSTKSKNDEKKKKSFQVFSQEFETNEIQSLSEGTRDDIDLTSPHNLCIGRDLNPVKLAGKNCVKNEENNIQARTKVCINFDSPEEYSRNKKASKKINKETLTVTNIAQNIPGYNEIVKICLEAGVSKSNEFLNDDTQKLILLNNEHSHHIKSFEKNNSYENDSSEDYKSNNIREASKEETAKSQMIVPNLKTYSNRRKKPNHHSVTPTIVNYSEDKESPNGLLVRTNFFLPKIKNFEEFPSSSATEIQCDEMLNEMSNFSYMNTAQTKNIDVLKLEKHPTCSEVIEKDLFHESTKIIDLVEEDDVIKNIAKKFTVSRIESTSKKRKYYSGDISTIKIPTHIENDLLDLPVFSSSSDDDEESGNSNILSILDESDNSDQPKPDSVKVGNKYDDTPVQKISPIANNEKLEYSIDTCLLQEKKSDQINVPSPSKTSCKISRNEPNVVFSTSNCKLKNTHCEWIDPAMEFEENFFSVQQSEISSPPIEEFTKSDKTLFQTFLNKVNENCTPTNSKKINTHPFEISHIKSKRETFLKQKPIMHKKGFAKYVDVPKLNEPINTLQNNHRRKTVSFTNIKEEKVQKNQFFPRPSPGKEIDHNGEKSGVSSINTNGHISHQMKTFSTSYQPKNPTINMRFQQKRNQPSDPGMENNKTLTYDELCSHLTVTDTIKKDIAYSPNQNSTFKLSYGKDGKLTANVENFPVGGTSTVKGKSSNIEEDFVKNLSPMLPNDDLREVLNDDRFLLYYDDENESRNREYEPNTLRDVANISSNSYYSSDLGFSVQNWLEENLDKRLEGQISLPLKKRRKLSQYSDNLSVKEEEIQCLDSIKMTADVENKGLISEHISNSSQCNSYPSTPMLSIANFENMICFTQSPRRQFKTPGQLKEITPLNLQSLKILPAQHTIVSSNNSTSCPDSSQSVQTINILPSQPTHVTNNCANAPSVQTYSIIPSQTNIVSANTRNIFSDQHIYNLTSHIQPAPEIKSVNMSFDLSSRGELPSIQTFTLPSNTVQCTHPFHPNSQLAYSIHSNQSQNNISALNVPSLDIQNMINLSNYQMNSQHLSNYLHNSQINLQAKQAVLCNDVPCNLQVNNSHLQPVIRQNKHNENSFNSILCSYECNDDCNGIQQYQNNCESCKKNPTKTNNSFLSPNISNKTNKTKKIKSRSTDRITRSSNRTTVVNYRDEGPLDSRTNAAIARKKRNITSSRK